jgi:hypothetical protein
MSQRMSQPVASYYGSVGRGIDFYHIDLCEVETAGWLNINNCGIVVIRKGSISLNELEKELFHIFCKNCPQIRELIASKYMVRFPPHQKVSNIKNLPSFNMRKEEVQVEVMEWIGDLDHFSELKEVLI